MDLHITQLNAQRSKSVFDDLRVKISGGQPPDILLLQEPYLFEGRTLTLSGYQAVVGGSHPKAAIYIKNNIDFIKLAQVSSDCLIAITIHTGGAPLSFASAYFRGIEVDPITDDLNRLDRLCTDIKGGLVMGLDANARSTLWHSRRSNRRGNELLDLIIQRNLEILNAPGHLNTFCDTRGQGDNIDVTLARSMSSNIHNWRVEDWSISDHRPITFQIKITNLPAMENWDTPWYRYGKAKWHVFERILDRDIRLQMSPPSVEWAAETLEESITEALRVSVPTLTPGGPRDVAWWSPLLDSLRRDVLRARHECSRDSCDRTWAVYRRARNKYVAYKKKSKRDSWRAFVTDTGAKDPFCFATKLVRNKINNNIILSSMLTEAGPTASLQETMSYILTCLFPRDLHEVDTDEHKMIRYNSTLPSEGEESEEFTSEELVEVLSSLGPKKAPGLDGITTVVVKRAWPYIQDLFLRTVNLMLNTGCFPSRWKVANVRLIPKKNDLDTTDIKAFRPISLLSVLSKIAEKLVLKRLSVFFDYSDFLSTKQYGFIKGRSTVDLLWDVGERIKDSQEKLVVGILLDISGAFDNAWWPYILQSLRDRGCPRNLYRVLSNYLSDRKAELRCHGIRITRSLDRGCPQGSVLGPHLWNVIMDGLLRIDLGPDVELYAYADDVTMIVRGSSRAAIERTAGEALRRVTEWGVTAKLSFSAGKTQAILLKGKLDVDCPPRIFMDAERIKFSPHVKCLGVLIGRGWTFSNHVREISAKARDAFLKLRRISRANWGLDGRSLYILYRSIFEGIVTYAAPVWADSLRLVRTRQILLSGQRTALLAMTKGYRTIAGDALPVIGGVLPADLLVRFRAGKFLETRGLSVVEGGPKERLRLLHAEWQTRWDNSQKGRWTYSLLPSITDRMKQKKWLYVDHYLTQFLSGHGNFRAKLHSMALVEGPECLDCGALVDDVEHATWSCPILDTDVGRLIRELEGFNLTAGDWSGVLKDRNGIYSLKGYIRNILKEREGLYNRFITF